MSQRFAIIGWIRNRLVEIAKSREASEQARRKVFSDLKKAKAIKREKAIKLKAYYFWEADGSPEGKENYYWSKAEEELITPARKYHSHIRVFLEWIGLFGNIALLLAAITYLTYGSQKQRDLEVSQAWSVITNAKDQKGNGGRIEALELINASPSNSGSWRFPWLSWQFPWVVSKWPKESLAALEAPGAYLGGIQLPNANLVQANLQSAKLPLANLQEARLDVSHLQGALLIGTDLRGASLVRANLSQAILTNAYLSCSFDRKERQCTSLLGAQLQGAELSGANLQGAEIFAAQFQRAFLIGTDFRGTIIDNSVLSSVNFEGARYTDDKFPPELCSKFLQGNDGSCPTQFPEDFDPRAAGMILVTEENFLTVLKELSDMQLKSLGIPKLER